MPADAKGHTLDISRRGFIRDAALMAGAGALLGAGLTASPATAGSKFSQHMAKYQPTPKGAASCANCTQFQPPETCQVVEGKISASGWCFLYAHKAG
jgi:hypothetical protein